MIEVRLEYGGSRVINTATDFEDAMVMARRMLDRHAISEVKWQRVQNKRHLAEAKGRSLISGNEAFLYMFDNDGRNNG